MPTIDVHSALQSAVRRLQQTDTSHPTLEARILVEHALEQSRAWILAHPNHELSDSAWQRLQQLLDRRLNDEPTAYIVSRKEFYGVDLYVDSRVLVPRPETEVLVDRVLAVARHRGSGLSIVDVGTGSGAIALAIALALPNAEVTAVDRSAEALAVAAVNRSRLSARVNLLQGDLLTWLGQRVDVIVANLPYIPSEAMAQLPDEVLKHEPHLALDGGPRGLRLNTGLIKQAASRLRIPGHLFAECEPEQIESLAAVATCHLPNARIESIADGFGHPRFLHVETQE